LLNGGSRLASARRFPSSAPLRDQVLVGTGLDAQPGGEPGPGLVEVALTGAEQDACHFGQQVTAASGYLPELGHGRTGLGLGQRSPARVPVRDTRQPGHKQPASIRSTTMILIHLARIEHADDRFKSAGLIS